MRPSLVNMRSLSSHCHSFSNRYEVQRSSLLIIMVQKMISPREELLNAAESQLPAQNCEKRC